MFIISLTYTVPLELVDKHLEDHVAFLNKQYELGHFAASGRKVPRTGGIILSMMSNKKELLNILEQDPFKIQQLAHYDITQFVPSKTSEALKFLLE